MDITPRGLIRAFAYQIPALTLNTCLAAAGLSRNSSHQDLLTELITLWARPVLRTPAALLKSQQAFNYDYGVWGRIWVSKWTVPIDVIGLVDIEGGREKSEKSHEGFDGEDGARSEAALTLQQAVESAILELGDGNVTGGDLSMSDLDPVQTEWTAYRGNVSHVAMRPDLSERDMYTAMMEDTDPSGPTILYFHGGAHCLMDPTTHRWTTSTLSQKSDGRVLSVRYRLAPQHIFPAALLDALSAYLALLAPPPNAFHEAVAPSKIVLAGDSSGGGLAASLLLLLQTLCRRKQRIAFHGKTVMIPDPVCSGLALTSPWLDITRCLPSTTANARWDIIAPRRRGTRTPRLHSQPMPSGRHLRHGLKHTVQRRCAPTHWCHLWRPNRITGAVFHPSSSVSAGRACKTRPRSLHGESSAPTQNAKSLSSTAIKACLIVSPCFRGTGRGGRLCSTGLISVGMPFFPLRSAGRI